MRVSMVMVVSSMAFHTVGGRHRSLQFCHGSFVMFSILFVMVSDPWRFVMFSILLEFVLMLVFARLCL